MHISEVCIMIFHMSRTNELCIMMQIENAMSLAKELPKNCTLLPCYSMRVTFGVCGAFYVLTVILSDLD